MKSSERHTLSNQEAQLKEAETVNLIENDAKSLSFGACGCCCECVNTSHSFPLQNWFIQLQIG